MFKLSKKEMVWCFVLFFISFSIFMGAAHQVKKKKNYGYNYQSKYLVTRDILPGQLNCRGKLATISWSTFSDNVKVYTSSECESLNNGGPCHLRRKEWLYVLNSRGQYVFWGGNPMTDTPYLVNCGAVDWNTLILMYANLAPQRSFCVRTEVYDEAVFPPKLLKAENVFFDTP